MRFFRFIIIFLFLPISTSAFAEICDGPKFSVFGLERTDLEWFRDYLQLDLKRTWSEEQRELIRKKLMTTDIFTAVEIADKNISPDQCEINITVIEKWTRIPVVRGAYGGGTPLLILGGYETNAFGRLLAMGGEIRRYGRMAPGAFFFFKSPRAWRGRGLWGGELWLDRRRRDFFDDEGVVYGHANSESWTAKMQILYPLTSDQSSGWQYGMQAQLSRESPATFLLEENYRGHLDTAPGDLEISSKAGFGGVVGPMLAYDNLTVEGLNYAGVKSRASIGVSRGANSSGRFYEAELYGFSRHPHDINLAARLFAARTSEHTIGAVYYLGGFDSIRGLPDGVHYGNNIAYGNFEARVVAARFKYAHVQPAMFIDTGASWMSGQSAERQRETSVGGGVRISVPQIYRFVIRFDYGVSIGHTKSRGVSIGLNQFFQPYKLVF